MIRSALQKIGIYFYCLPTFKQARLVIFDSITNTGERFLDYIPKQLIASINQQEMKIKLVNGSIIQLTGSDSYDTSLVGSNARMIVFSEYGTSDSRAYTLAARPILNANGGTVIILGCVSPDTLVIGENGLARIKDISAERTTYSDLNKKVWGLGGFHNAEQFYYGGRQPTHIITLESGFRIECTAIHPLWNGKEWVRAQDLKVGDLIPIQYGQDQWGKGISYLDLEFEINEDLFYLLGLIHADGCYGKDTVCVTKKKDPEIIEFLRSFGFKTKKDGIHHTYYSVYFCSALEDLEFKHGARNKEFPNKLFDCSREQMKAFIQGIFDGDGTSNSHPSKRGAIKFTSTCLEFIQDLQIVLLNFGVVGSIRSEFKEPTERVKVSSLIYNLEITGHFAHIFYREIGFRLERKQNNWRHVPQSCKEESGNVYPVDIARLPQHFFSKGKITNPNRITRRILKRFNEHKTSEYVTNLLNEKFFYSPIKSIESSGSEVFDFIIPETNSFFSNGFISHNTPRGKNHFYEMYQIAKNSEDWFCYFQTLSDTQHIDEEEIKKEIASGEISEDLALQEYWCSFDLGVEGAYYAKFIDRLRLNNRIGDVPWEPQFKVHTAWDIGWNDSTCIIFYQVVGSIVRIIDFYESNFKPIDHYCKVIQSKPYLYGKHFVGHDIMVHEQGSGLTRYDMYKNLGVKFEQRDGKSATPNVSIEDGIEAVRALFARLWIDEKNCKHLIKCLENYHQEFDNKRKVYKGIPLHNWASHAADSARYMALTVDKVKAGTTAEDWNKHYQDARYGNNANMPAVFRDDLPKY